MRGADRRKARIERGLRSRQTDAERKRWFAVRDRRLSGFKFVRPEAIGPFIVDFVCRDKRLVVEVDGGQHADSAEDAARDAFLAGEGYRVMRFWNNDVLSNRDGVLTVILEALLQESCVWLPLAPPASAPLRRASQPARHSVSDGGHPLPRSASLRRERE